MYLSYDELSRDIPILFHVVNNSIFVLLDTNHHCMLNFTAYNNYKYRS